MADNAKTRIRIRKSRHKRIRNSLSGTGTRPRLCVRRSILHIYAQLVDDELGRAVLQFSSQSKEIRDQAGGKTKVEVARMVGKEVAQKSLEQGISNIVFDRGGYLYHGRVKALAESARENGLKF